MQSYFASKKTKTKKTVKVVAFCRQTQTSVGILIFPPCEQRLIYCLSMQGKFVGTKNNNKKKN